MSASRRGAWKWIAAAALLGTGISLAVTQPAPADSSTAQCSVSLEK